MNDDAFQRLIQKQILECRWSDISARWLNFLPAIDPPGSAPDVSLSDFISVSTVAETLSESIEYGTIVRAEAAGLRGYVFREAVYLLHKALHVSGCAENQVKRGYKTWSLADAYQASLFGAKAILHFCGIAFAEFGSKALLIDIFPKEQDTNKRRKQKLKLPEDPKIQFTRFNMQFQHKHIWAIFQRLLNVFDMNVWQDTYIRALRKIKTGEFAKQRNDLNYKNDLWIFDDLHQLVIDSSFGEHSDDMEESLAYSLESDFSLCLSFSILKMGLLLLEDISKSTNALNSEIQIIKDKLILERHPLYVACYP